MVPEETKKKIIDLIIKNRTDAALSKLLEVSEKNPTSRMKDKVVLLKAQYQRATQDNNASMISKEDYSIKQNRINQSILALLNERHETYSQDLQQKKASQTPITSWLFIGGVVLLLGLGSWYFLGNVETKPGNEKLIQEEKTKTDTPVVETVNPNPIIPSGGNKTGSSTSTTKSEKIIAQEKEPVKPKEVKKYFSILSPIDIGIIAYSNNKVNNNLLSTLNKHYKQSGLSTSTSITTADFKKDNYFNKLFNQPSLINTNRLAVKMKHLILADLTQSGNIINLKLIQYNLANGVANDFSKQLTLPSSTLPGKEQENIRKEILKYLRKIEPQKGL